jgi:hypothetical protein
MASNSLKDTLATYQARINGVQKHCASQTAILVDNVSYSPTQITALYQAEIAIEAKVAAARSALALVLAQAKPVRAQTAHFDLAFTRCIEGAYGSDPSVLADFGLKVKAPAAKTAETKAIANVKAQATKAVRHVMGPKQRAAIPPAEVNVQLVDASGTQPVSPSSGFITSATALPTATPQK